MMVGNGLAVLVVVSAVECEVVEWNGVQFACTHGIHLCTYIRRKMRMNKYSNDHHFHIADSAGQ